MKEQNKKSIGLIFLITVLISLIIVPLLVNIFFGFKSFDLLLAKWDAADALLYCGSILSFIGTIVLGAVSYYQTSVANEMAKNSENLAKRANELSRISQIIEYEKERLSALSYDFEILRNKVSFQGLVRFEGCHYDINHYLQLNSEVDPIFKHLENNISQTYDKYSSLIALLNGTHKFFDEYYNYHIIKTSGDSYPNDKLMHYNNSIYKELENIVADYMEYETREFRKLLFNDLSLDTIREEFSDRFSHTFKTD